MSTSTPVVVIAETLAEEPAAWLADRATLRWADPADPASLDALLPEADGLVVRTYTRVNAALLERAPRLRVVGRAGVGLDNVDLPACRGRGVPVVYTPDANTQAVVEYVLGLMLDAVRPRTDLPPDADAAAFHALRKSEVGRQLDELTLGILGFGRIGKRLGRVAHALGMNVHACDILPEVELRKAVSYPFEFVDHDALYAQSDIVSVHTDGRPENRHLLDAAALGRLRPGAILINAARGMLIDPAALADWARAQPGARVILDVHDPEPPAAGDPLRTLPNVRLLPHLASRTDAALENMSWVVRDVWAVLDGAPPHHPA